MLEAIVGLATLTGETILKTLPVTIALAIAFTVLNHFWACNPGPPWWRKRELATDVIYWFFIPTIARMVRIGSLVIGAGLIFGIQGEENIIAFFDKGYGPLAQVPFWMQIVLFIVLSDIALYWLHRIFHGHGLWRYHAIHHSSEDLDWISAARFHPVNILLGTVAVDVVLLLAGIPPKVLVWIGPFRAFHSAFVHANLNWTLGPLQYVIATPVFHRWHHTVLEEGGNTNFASTLPILDVLFGTFSMPRDRMPANYGAGDPTMPASFGAQLAHPLRQKALEPAE